MRKHLPVLILVLVFLCGIPVFAQDDVDVMNLEMEGIAVVDQNDVAGARHGAIQDALQKAILEVIAVLLSSPDKDKNHPPFKDVISAQHDKYIKNYKIIAEGNKTDTYTATLNVSVALPDLKSDLAKMGFLLPAEQDKAHKFVSLKVMGLKKYSDLSSLKEFLKKKIKMVKNVQPRYFMWQQACMEVEISGTIQAFADELVGTNLYELDAEQTKNDQIAVNLLQKEGE